MAALHHVLRYCDAWLAAAALLLHGCMVQYIMLHGRRRRRYDACRRLHAGFLLHAVWHAAPCIMLHRPSLHMLLAAAGRSARARGGGSLLVHVYMYVLASSELAAAGMLSACWLSYHQLLPATSSRAAAY